MKYLSLQRKKLEDLKSEYEKKYKEFKSFGLKLDMSRGKPSTEQLDLSIKLLDVINSSSNFCTKGGFDCRNYGLLDGIPEAKELFANLLGVKATNIFVGGNSSLNLMFDTISHFMFHGINDEKPWIKQEKVKFLCPSPGYDRHFAILDYFNIEPIVVPMTEFGPNMEIVEENLAKDESIKGIWCVPKYANPTGASYSNETVRRLAALRPKAKDFRIFWDNAYLVHDIEDQNDEILNIVDECTKNQNEDLPIIYCSTSKITFPGSGVAAIASSKKNIDCLKQKFSIQTVGFDKINQLRHAIFFKNKDGILDHMKKHKAILKPKFDLVLKAFESEFENGDIISWTKPNGGYFISVNVLPGCAKSVVSLCKDAGLALTSAGATYPKGFDFEDSNIRIAPTYPSLEELSKAMELFCICVKLAAFDKMLSINHE